MRKIKTIIVLLSGVYCLMPNDYLKVALLAGITSYLIYNITIIFQFIFGMIRKLYTDGMIETLQELESFTEEMKEMQNKQKNIQERLKQRLSEVFKIKPLF